MNLHTKMDLTSLSRSSRQLMPTIRLKEPTQRSLFSLLVGLLAHSRLQSGSKDPLTTHFSLT